MSMTFGPSTRLTVQLKLNPETDALTPLHRTERTPDSRSETVRWMLRLELETVDGMVAVERSGAVLSIFAVTVVVDVLPARSVAEPEAVWKAPSVVSVAGLEHEATPESVSKHVNSIVTSVLFQPAPFGDGLRPPVIVGAVLSGLTTAVVAALFPALSVAVPSTL